MQRVISGFSAGDVLVLQNEINLTEDIINAAVKKGMQIALNPSPMTPALLKCSLEKVTWFLLNEVEGEQMTGETEPEKIAGALLRQYPKSRIVLTLGPRGVLYPVSYTHLDVYKRQGKNKAKPAQNSLRPTNLRVQDMKGRQGINEKDKNCLHDWAGQR